MPKVAKSPLSLLGFFIWSIAALFFLYEFFLRTFVGSIAHQIIPDLHLNTESFAVIGSAYYAAYGLMQLPVGILIDKFSVKSVMVFSTLICAGATFLFTHSTGFTTAFLSRFLMGFGSSFAFVCLLVIAATWFPKKFFGFFAGISQFIGTMGPLLAGGPLLMLMATYHASWRVALGEIGAFGLVLSVLSLLFVKDKPRGGERVLIYLQRGEPLRLRLLRLLKNKQAWSVAFYSATVYISISLMGAIWGVSYFQSRGMSQHIAADMVSLAWLGYAIGCPLLGVISDIAKRRKPVLLFSAILGLCVTASIVYLPIHPAFFWTYSIFMFCLGVAAAGQNVGFAAISEHVDFGARATALGLNNGMITLFGVFIPPLATYFIHESNHGSIQSLAPNDFFIGLALMPIMYSISIFIAWFFIRETYCKPQKEAIKLTV